MFVRARSLGLEPPLVEHLRASRTDISKYLLYIKRHIWQPLTRTNSFIGWGEKTMFSATNVVIHILITS